MDSLLSKISEVSAAIGLEISVEELQVDTDDLLRLRFSALSRSNAFSLIASRSWRTTQLRFEPDPFAVDTVKYLCEQLLEESERLRPLIDNCIANSSDFSIKFDGVPYGHPKQVISTSPTLSVEAELLSSESSLDHGLVTEAEFEMFDSVLRMLAAALPKPTIVIGSPDEVTGYPEGAVTKVLVNRYERDPKNRKLAIEIHGSSCVACGFNFLEKYGLLGGQYIVVHHVTPVSQIGDDYRVDPSTDLVTLCANCHAMVHREDPPLSIDELKEVIFKASSN
jgi:5-methylcytosine-specific restriction protein A